MSVERKNETNLGFNTLSRYRKERATDIASKRSEFEDLVKTKMDKIGCVHVNADAVQAESKYIQAVGYELRCLDGKKYYVPTGCTDDELRDSVYAENLYEAFYKLFTLVYAVIGVCGCVLCVLIYLKDPKM